MSRPPVAYIDESFIQRPGSPGVYLLAAVLAEADDIDAMTEAARTAARGREYHSTDLHKLGHVGVIEDMLDTVVQHAAWTAVVAHTPITDGNEAARQAALRRMLTYLDHQRIRDVTLDLRGSPTDWDRAYERGLKMPACNYRDLRTYRNMVADGAISHRMRLIHVNDRDQPGLWLADAVAWSTRRALHADEPQWWLRVADAATIIESATGRELTINDSRTALPRGDRGPHTPSQSAQTMLLSQQEYPASTSQGESRGSGRYLTSLIAQAEQARAAVPSVVVGHDLVTQVQTLTAEIAEIRRQIMAPQPAREADGTDHLPMIHEPEIDNPAPDERSGPSLD